MSSVTEQWRAGFSEAEIQAIFDQYIYGFIFHDIQREIDLAKRKARWEDDTEIGGGNVLAALGLLCYTEFMGGVLTGSRGSGSSRKNFEEFFDYMGKPYTDLRKTVDVYDLFRCGLAHEYFVKRDCDVAMAGQAACGIGQDPTNGRYFFVVEQYFRDFACACRKVNAQLCPTLVKQTVTESGQS